MKISGQHENNSVALNWDGGQSSCTDRCKLQDLPENVLVNIINHLQEDEPSRKFFLSSKTRALVEAAISPQSKWASKSFNKALTHLVNRHWQINERLVSQTATTPEAKAANLRVSCLSQSMSHLWFWDAIEVYRRNEHLKIARYSGKAKRPDYGYELLNLVTGVKTFIDISGDVPIFGALELFWNMQINHEDKMGLSNDEEIEKKLEPLQETYLLDLCVSRSKSVVISQIKDLPRLLSRLRPENQKILRHLVAIANS